MEIRRLGTADAAAYRALRLRGVEPRAIRVGDRYFDKDHMILFLTPP